MIKINNKKFILFAGLLILGLSYNIAATVNKSRSSTPRYSSPSPKVIEIKTWTGPESSQIAFYFQGRVNYNVTDLPENKGFVLYTSNAPVNGGQQSYNVKDGVIDRIDAKNSSSGCRITVTFMEPTDYKLSPDYAGRDYPVIEIIRPLNLRPPRPTPQQIAELKKDHKIVLIDPGHGGWHSGAGRNGLLEKYVTLQLALRLKDKIDRMPGYIAFITRDTGFNGGDYYVSLARRREMAIEYGADCFLSIHLNAPGNNSRKDVRGTEIYYLAYGDASDAEAQELANLENAADLEPGEENKKGDLIFDVLQDERLIALNNQNSLLAGLVMGQMLQVDGLSNRGVKHARFTVLKNPVPSILVEVLFVTNQHEARLISDPVFQRNVTQKMSDAITQYFAINRGRPTSNGNGTDATSKTLTDVLSSSAD